MFKHLFQLICVIQFAAGDLLSWIASEHPKNLSKTMKLASNSGQLLANAGGRNLVLIIPTNSAWDKHESLYNQLLNDESLRLGLIVDAAVEVPEPVHSLADIPKNDLITVGGTPIVVDPKDPEGKTVYFGVFKDDGSVKKVGSPIKLKAKPVKVFDNITIFEATSFAKPPSMRSLSSREPPMF